MKTFVTVESNVVRSPRVIQMEGIFDVPPSKSAKLSWDVDLPIEDRPWQIGLIVGPSGSGKSTVARTLWPHAYDAGHALEGAWPANKSILDGFPESMSVRDVIELLNSVGFSSPPAWVRPYWVLSTGEQFRTSVALELAAALATQPWSGPIVFDEFTSVVDRTVAQIGSAAVARTVRSHAGLQFVAVTCHYDVEPWLQPDWVYSPADGSFTWKDSEDRQRPKSSSAFSESIIPLGDYSATTTI